MTRACRRCGKAFQTTRAHFHSYWACWSAANATAPTDAASETRREIERLRLENERLRVMAAQPRVAFDAATIRQLLQVCHPDKNGGSALATEVTKKLLRMREGAT